MNNQILRLVEGIERGMHMFLGIGLDVKQGHQNGLADTEVVFSGHMDSIVLL